MQRCGGCKYSCARRHKPATGMGDICQTTKPSTQAGARAVRQTLLAALCRGILLCFNVDPLACPITIQQKLTNTGSSHSGGVATRRRTCTRKSHQIVGAGWRDTTQGSDRAQGTPAAACATRLMRTRSSREAISGQRRFDLELSASSCAWFAASERILEGVRRQRSTTMESYVGAKERILLLAHTVSVGPCSNVGRASMSDTISTATRQTSVWCDAHLSEHRLARNLVGIHWSALV